MRKAVGVTTSTNKEEVEVFPHMAKGGLGVLIDNSTVWTEGQLPVLSANGNRLPYQAFMPVEACEEELLVRAHAYLRRHHSCQARQLCANNSR